MLRVQAGDPDAFRALYDRLASHAYRTAFAIARDSPHVDDIVQEAFLSLWRGRAGFRPESGTVTAWMMGIVRHCTVDSLRHHRRHDSGRLGVDDDFDQPPSRDRSVEETIMRRDEAARLRGALARLPSAQRDVIALAYFGELSASEIAHELSLPLGTVKGRMRLGLHKLRGDVNP